MLKDDFATGQEVEPDLMNIVIGIPSNTFCLDITAKMLDDNNEIVDVKTRRSLSDIHYHRDDYVRNLDSEFNIDKDFADGEDMINIIIQIPRDALWLDLGIYRTDTYAVFCDSQQMRASDIHKARELFLERIPDGDEYNVRYVLTEKGQQALQDLLSGNKTAEEIFGDDFFKETEDD